MAPKSRPATKSKVSKLIEEDGAVVGVSGMRHGTEPFEVRGDVVVGADGRYSHVAKLGGFKPAYEHHDFDLIWFAIEQPPGMSWSLKGTKTSTASFAGRCYNRALRTCWMKSDFSSTSSRSRTRFCIREADVRALHRLQLRAQQRCSALVVEIQ